MGIPNWRYSFAIDKDIEGRGPRYAAAQGYPEGVVSGGATVYYPGGYTTLEKLSEEQQKAGPGRLFVGGARRRTVRRHRVLKPFRCRSRNRRSSRRAVVH